jgi:predicted peptidase
MRIRPAIVCVLLLLATRAGAADIQNLRFRMPDGSDVLYGLLVPDSYRASQPAPLILALHPGGERMRYYGSAYTRAVVAPATASLKAVIVAPDCPTGSWADARADAAVMALLGRIMGDYSIDRRRVLVVGYSMGGRGTWFMSSHHRDLFTAAIPMAAATGDDPLESLATMPTYIIHSRRDQVVPFAPAERNARELERLGRSVKFDALSEPTHFDMGAYVPALRRAVAWVEDQWARR